MEVHISPSWKSLLSEEFEKPYFKSLTDFVKKEYKEHTCYPKGKDIFAAFDQCPIDKLKVVLLGQDPYHGEGQANGLSFSVNEGIAHPPSLVNIFKEIEEDINVPYPESGNLSRWAQQGVDKIMKKKILLQYAPTRPVAISIRDGKLLPTLSSSLSLTTAKGLSFFSGVVSPKRKLP